MASMKTSSIETVCQLPNTSFVYSHNLKWFLCLMEGAETIYYMKWAVIDSDSETSKVEMEIESNRAREEDRK